MRRISRQPLRTQIRRLLIEQILVGEMEPDSQIRETELTEELGVSRTPLREALLQLVFEGFLEAIPGKGFRVRPLTAREADELFTVGLELETLALRLAGGVSPEQLEKLRAINRERAELLEAETVDRDTLVELDDRWHRLLVANCENRQLQRLLRLVRNRLYRYTHAFEGHRQEVRGAVKDHEEIQDVLEAGELGRAVELLRRHWKTGQATMSRLIEEESEARTEGA